MDLVGLGPAPVDQVVGHLAEEARRRVVGGRAPRGPHQRPGEVEPLAGAGEPDVREPALLLELAAVVEAARVGEDAVLEPGEEHGRELQALGGVEGHQGDHAAVVVVGRVGDLVGVGDQGHPLEEVDADFLERVQAPGRRHRPDPRRARRTTTAAWSP